MKALQEAKEKAELNNSETGNLMIWILCQIDQEPPRAPMQR